MIMNLNITAIELKQTLLCEIFHALSLDTHNGHIVVAIGHGHNSHNSQKWP